jgi:hypothetical protein
MVPFKSKKAKAEEISAQTENPLDEESEVSFVEDVNPYNETLLTVTQDTVVSDPAPTPALDPPQDDPARIRVLHIYQGRRTNEQKIMPGVYEWDDARLYGLSQYLLDNKHAVEVVAK